MQQLKNLHFAEWEKYVCSTAKTRVTRHVENRQIQIDPKKLRKAREKDTGKVLNPHSSSN